MPLKMSHAVDVNNVLVQVRNMATAMDEIQQHDGKDGANQAYSTQSSDGLMANGAEARAT